MTERRVEFDELRAGRAIGELEPDESARLEELGREFDDDDDFDRLIGEVTASLAAGSAEAMPVDLYDRIAAAGEKALGVAPKDTPERTLKVVRDEPKKQGASRAGAGFMAWSGWAVAAAMAALWIGGVGQQQPPPPPGPEVPPTLAEIRSQLIDGQGDAVEVAWTATEDPAAASATGDVVWSNTDQAGVMRFVGLEANNPAELRYQLWIFDAARDERYPIDGGLFDVAPGQTEVLVPVDARLQVREPTLFAVTVETPDGVVVSDRERIVVVAPMADQSQAGQ